MIYSQFTAESASKKILTKSFAIIEGPRDVLVSRNLATIKYPI